MPRVTYIEHDGTEHVVEVPAGHSVMEGAVHNSINGIEAQCGGSCACATCHVYVDPEWLARLPPRQSAENDMLECTAAERRANSRLGCQIRLTADMDGLIVRMPEFQS
jgi:2Fe-2S ferredoxin